MALIDLTTQALPPQVPSKVLPTTSVTESATGTFRIKWDDISIDLLSTGSFDLGIGNHLIATAIYATGSNGQEEAIRILPSNGPDGPFSTGSVIVQGDLIVRGNTTQQNVESMVVKDPILDLNYSGSAEQGLTDSDYGGLRIARSGSNPAKIVFEESSDRWRVDVGLNAYSTLVSVDSTDTLTNKTITGLANSTLATSASLTLDGGFIRGGRYAQHDNEYTTKAYVDAALGSGEFGVYFRKNFVKKAGTINATTASFTAVTASAPGSLTATNEQDFSFFINGAYMEHDALTIQQDGGQFLLKVDSDEIGYTLESDDEIIAHGKFNS